MELHEGIIGVSAFCLFAFGLIAYASYFSSDTDDSLIMSNEISGVTENVVNRTTDISTQLNDFGGWFSGGIETIKLAIDIIPITKTIIAGIIDMIVTPLGMPEGTGDIITLILGGIISILICAGVLKAVFK